MVVAPESVCPKWMTGALKLKFGGINGALYPVGAEIPGARPGAPDNRQFSTQINDREKGRRDGGSTDTLSISIWLLIHLFSQFFSSLLNSPPPNSDCKIILVIRILFNLFKS